MYLEKSTHFMTAQYHAFSSHLPNMDTRVLETHCSINAFTSTKSNSSWWTWQTWHV